MSSRNFRSRMNVIDGSSSGQLPSSPHQVKNSLSFTSAAPLIIKSSRPSAFPDFILIPFCLALFVLLTTLLWHLPRQCPTSWTSLLPSVSNFVGTSELLLAANFDPPNLRLYELVPGADRVHELVALAFAFAFVFDLLTGVIPNWKDTSQRRVASMMCLINFISCIAYISYRVGHTPLHLDFVGRPLNLYRMVHWCFTSNTMLYMMGYLGQAPSSRILQAIAMQLICLFGGMVCSYIPLWPHGWWVWGLSNATFVYMVAVYMWRFLGDGMEIAMHPDNERYISRLRIGSVVIWSVFGVVWMLGKLQLVSLLTEETLMALSDMSAKLLISFTLYHANFLDDDRLELVRQLLRREQNVFMDVDSARRTKRAIEQLQRIISATFRDSPLLNRESMLFMRLLLQQPSNIGVNDASSGAKWDAAQKASNEAGDSDDLNKKKKSTKEMSFWASTAELLNATAKQGAKGLAAVLKKREREFKRQQQLQLQKDLEVKHEEKLQNQSKEVKGDVDGSAQAQFREEVAEGSSGLRHRKLTPFQRKFLERMRHEFRDPLNSVIAFSYSMFAASSHTSPSSSPSSSDAAGSKRSPLPSSHSPLDNLVDSDEHRDILLQAMAAAHSLLLLIDNMLEFSTAQDMKVADCTSSDSESDGDASPLFRRPLSPNKLYPGYKPVLTDFNLLTLVDALNDYGIQRGASKLARGNLELLISYNHRTPTALQGDAQRLFLICRNMLDNAVKFTSARSGGMIRAHFDFEDLDEAFPPVPPVQAESWQKATPLPPSSAPSSFSPSSPSSSSYRFKSAFDSKLQQLADAESPSASASASASTFLPQLRRRILLRMLFQDSGSPTHSNNIINIDESAAVKQKLAGSTVSSSLSRVNLRKTSSKSDTDAENDGSEKEDRAGAVDDEDDDASDSPELMAGLGLVVVRSLVEMMDGTFYVHPPSNFTISHGTCVTIELPMFVNSSPPTFAVKQNLLLRLPAPQQRHMAERSSEMYHSENDGDDEGDDDIPSSPELSQYSSSSLPSSAPMSPHVTFAPSISAFHGSGLSKSNPQSAGNECTPAVAGMVMTLTSPSGVVSRVTPPSAAAEAAACSSSLPTVSAAAAVSSSSSSASASGSIVSPSVSSFSTAVSLANHVSTSNGNVHCDPSVVSASSAMSSSLSHTSSTTSLISSISSLSSASSLSSFSSTPASSSSSSLSSTIPLRIGLRLPPSPLRTCLVEILSSAGAAVRIVSSDQEMLQLIISQSVQVLIYNASGVHVDRMLLLALRSFGGGLSSSTPSPFGPASSGEAGIAVTPHTLLVRVDPLFALPDWLAERPLITRPPSDVASDSTTPASTAPSAAASAAGVPASPVSKARSSETSASTAAPASASMTAFAAASVSSAAASAFASSASVTLSSMFLNKALSSSSSLSSPSGMSTTSSPSSPSSEVKPDAHFATPLVPNRTINSLPSPFPSSLSSSLSPSSQAFVSLSSTGVTNANTAPWQTLHLSSSSRSVPSPSPSPSFSSSSSILQRTDLISSASFSSASNISQDVAILDDMMVSLPPQLLSRLVSIRKPINLPSLMRTLQKVCYAPSFF